MARRTTDDPIPSRNTAYPGIEWARDLFGVLAGLFGIASIIMGVAAGNEYSAAHGWIVFGILCALSLAGIFFAFLLHGVSKIGTDIRNIKDHLDE